MILNLSYPIIHRLTGLLAIDNYNYYNGVSKPNSNQVYHDKSNNNNSGSNNTNNNLSCVSNVGSIEFNLGNNDGNNNGGNSGNCTQWRLQHYHHKIDQVVVMRMRHMEWIRKQKRQN